MVITMLDDDTLAERQNDPYWQRHYDYEKAVYDARSSGLSWPKIAVSEIIFQTWRVAHPSFPTFGSRELSLGQVKNAYARHCKRLSLDSDGPTSRKQETMWEAVTVLASVGWNEQAIASAFGINVKSVASRIRRQTRSN